MLFIDIIVLVLLGWYGFRGFKNGLIYEVACILALVLGCWAAKELSEGAALLVTGTRLAKPVAFAFIFSVVLLLVHIAGRVGAKIVKLVIPGAVDHIFGMLFGCCKVMVVCSTLFYCLQMADRKEILLKREFKEKSIAYQYIEPIVPYALHWHKDYGKTDEL